MSLINELRAKSESVESKRAEIIAEIQASFDKILDSERFEEHLKQRIDASDIKARKTFMDKLYPISLLFWLKKGKIEVI